MGLVAILLASALAFMAMTTTDGASNECRHMASSEPIFMPDRALSASSSRLGCTPQYSRLVDDNSCGAWCPADVVRSTSHEWLQFDLGRMTNVTYIETGGRFANGRGSEYTPSYRLQYNRGDNSDFTWYTDPANGRSGEPKVFEGNMQTHTSRFEFTPWLLVRRLRVVPYTGSDVGQAMCLRVRINGCYTDGVVSYSVVPAPSRQPWDGMRVEDTRFDGDTSLVGGNALQKGLGQLTDGAEAANFLQMAAGVKKGSGWVGWKNDSNAMGRAGSEHVTLTLEFDAVRNFSKIRLHTNNQFSHDSQVFRKVHVMFSIGGEHYSDMPIVFLTPHDYELQEQPRNMELILSAGGRIARFIKLELYFGARWMLISEVSFDSSIVTVPVEPEAAPPSALPDIGRGGTIRPTLGSGSAGAISGRGASRSPPTETSGSDVKGADDDLNLDYERQPPQHPSEGMTLDNQTIGIIAGASAGACMLIVCLVIISCLCRRHAKHTSPGHYVDQQFVLQNGYKSGAMTARSVAYAGVPLKDGTYEEPWGRCLPQPPLVLQARSMHPATSSNGYVSDGTGSICDYAMIPDMGPQAMLLPSGHYISGQGQMRQPPSYSACHTLIAGCPSIQGASGSSMFGVSGQELPRDDSPVAEFPQNSLRFVEKLGEGQFGEVHLCEIAAIGVNEMGTADKSGSSGQLFPLLVAVKVLKRDAGEATRKDFQREIKILSRLRDPNIVRVLGVCLREEPPCVIVEYMKHGDLHEFLRRHHAADGSLLRCPADSSSCEGLATFCSSPSALSRGSLIYMASQVASGMKYLESLNMVHRDLAARNVLVGPLYSVKISDFGMSRRLYSCDYYRVEGKVVLPIRWMAWESILLGKFTTRSDVWSFGVLLWEIFTFAREPPFRQWADEQVIENCVHYHRGDNMETILQKPDYCPKEVYDLMRECWNGEDQSRPSFGEIHMFLMRKNVGYDSRQDRMDMRYGPGRATQGDVVVATRC